MARVNSDVKFGWWLGIGLGLAFLVMTIIQAFIIRAAMGAQRKMA